MILVAAVFLTVQSVAFGGASIREDNGRDTGVAARRVCIGRTDMRMSADGGGGGAEGGWAPEV